MSKSSRRPWKGSNISRVGGQPTELRKLGPCDPKTRPGGVLLLQSDLGLAEWLYSNLTAANTGDINYRQFKADGGPMLTSRQPRLSRADGAYSRRTHFLAGDYL
jgi:hypothetical protein